jgi:hypothetical protein
MIRTRHVSLTKYLLRILAKSNKTGDLGLALQMLKKVRIVRAKGTTHTEVQDDEKKL